jgi:hypothetical protein
MTGVGCPAAAGRLKLALPPAGCRRPAPPWLRWPRARRRARRTACWYSAPRAGAPAIGSTSACRYCPTTVRAASRGQHSAAITSCPLTSWSTSSACGQRRCATAVRCSTRHWRVGQPQWPTPPGEFYVRDELTDYAGPFYGPVAFGTSVRSSVLTDWPRRVRRHPWHRRAAIDSEPRIARLHPPAQPRHLAPGAAHADRHSADDPVIRWSAADPRTQRSRSCARAHRGP